MNIRNLQGLALIVSAIGSLVGFLGPDTPLFGAISAISTVLFIIGIPAVYTAQPIGTVGLAGMILIIVAAVIALGFQLLDIAISPAVENILFWTSAIGGSVGRLIVGWLTTRHEVFPAWVGWAFIVEGLLNAIGAVIDLGALTDAYVAIVILVGTVALPGYGYYLLRPRATPALS
jgi:hypothetical protein